MVTDQITKKTNPPRRRNPAAEEWILAIDRALVPKLRTRRQFAEQEIRIPDGKYKGLPFRCSRAPWTGLWFDELDSGRWNRHALIGCVQSGKTLVGYVIPMDYHLFEIAEKVIGAIPNEEMANDKWNDDIAPVIEQSRYRDMLPKKGAGSKGGNVDAIYFLNGSMLKWMTGGGKDQKRSGFTSRVVIMTEVDKMDDIGSNSDETDKISQFEARTQSYDDGAFIIMECTVSTSKGRIWKEYTQGSESQIMKQCPHCHTYVNPVREHFVGWQKAETEYEAADAAHFVCPACQHSISQAERIAMLPSSKLIHRGQEIDEEGNITGDMPRTRTLGFRYNAFDNPFVSIRTIAVAEWKARREPDPEAAERKMLQFWWSTPTQDEADNDLGRLQYITIIERQRDYVRGMVPKNSVVTAAIDVGKWSCHWAATAWQPDCSGHVLDYDVAGVPSDAMMPERAIQLTLRNILESFRKGWEQPDGEIITPRIVLIDAGYLTDYVYEVCRTFKIDDCRIYPSKGFGERTELYEKIYSDPRRKKNIHWIGDHCHLAAMPHGGVYLCEMDADFWKFWMFNRWSAPLDTPGSMSLYKQDPYKHTMFAKHQMAEKPVEIIRAGRGKVIVFEELSKNNHLGDAMYMTGTGAYLAGIRISGSVAQAAPKSQPEAQNRFVNQYGQPFLVTER